MTVSDEEKSLTKGCALIRAVFKVDPSELEDETFADLLSQALYVEQYRLFGIAQILGNMFAGEAKD